MQTLRAIPMIPEEQRTPLVVSLLEIIAGDREFIRVLLDDLARLKGHKPKPRIKPSTLEKDTKKKEGDSEKRPGSAKRKKTKELAIHRIEIVKAENVPKKSVFKGYQDFTVQGLLIQPYNTRYRRERWVTPEGESIVAPLPDYVRALGGHFDAALISFILYQYYQCHVTQPLILEELRDLGIDISAGQVNRIITEEHDRFHKEKDEILQVGLAISSYINVDDTGARHEGKNCYCTHIGNEMFAWFETTRSKSRSNFLKIMRAGKKDYVLNSTAFNYMNAKKLPKAKLQLLADCQRRVFEDEADWKAALDSLGFTSERHIRIATEATLLGSILEHGVINPNLVILSDDAGQFDILLHALCWIHAERAINKLVGFTDAQRDDLEQVRSRVWEFYGQLKAYKLAPAPEKKAELEQRFDQIFTTRTCFESLNKALHQIHKNKSELLLVLDRPEIPLHNNGSETDIRDQVKKRVISGSTRSDPGRRCRDTFASLKKTCRKLGLGFWEYIEDRVSGLNSVPWLPDLMKQRRAVFLE